MDLSPIFSCVEFRWTMGVFGRGGLEEDGDEEEEEEDELLHFFFVFLKKKRK